MPAICAPLPDLPTFYWQQRSDWINVKKDVKPAAIGDGINDDTVAIQTALNTGSSGKTIYLPPGVYRVTQTLAFHGRGTGSAVIGHGRLTRLVWDGSAGGRMFWSDGVAYSRYIGLIWDGQGRAAVGFDHAAEKGFETEILHESECFQNFTDYGIRVGKQQIIASAEILFDNCLFENCGTGLGLLTFNDYDNTIDGCKFRNCGMGVRCCKSNFYARNCHFIKSYQADFFIGAEHGCSIRRCTSISSGQFVQDQGIAPLTIEDCHISNWDVKSPAIDLNGGPTLMFDCSIHPITSNCVPVKLGNRSIKLILSGNQPIPVALLVPNSLPRQIYLVPSNISQRKPTLLMQNFLLDAPLSSKKVFDVVLDYHAHGNGKSDDTAAIQSAIDAAQAFGNGAIAYMPTGRYRVSRSLRISGADFRFEGSGFNCGLIWRGVPNQPLITVNGAVNVTLANFAVGMHDWGSMDHGDDILITSKADKPVWVVLDGIYAFGMYQNAPDKHGIHFLNLPSGSLVDAKHLQGNIRITDCDRAQLLFRTSYEGTATVEGKGFKLAYTESRSDQHLPPNTQHNAAAWQNGITGFLTRVSTISKPALRVCDNNSIVMSDFFNESCDQIGVFSGDPGQPAGRITIQGPKFHLNTTNSIFEIHNYSGDICCLQSQFYCMPDETRFKSTGTLPMRLILAGNSWYHNCPRFDLVSSAKVISAGNVGVFDSPNIAHEIYVLSSVLDDLRRLDELDKFVSAMEKSKSASE